ncbi:ABC transporter permease [Ottowia sp.]|uniref:ABC transporter permease n=1 Tax=Ottowia sp. TaxID=1898956 RepID=UPI003A87805D
MSLSLQRLATVTRKELVDLLRDRKSIFWALFTVAISGPLVLAIIFLVAQSVVDRVERTTIPIVHAEVAPDLLRFLERRGVRIEKIDDRPADYEAKIKSGDLDAVLVLPKDFGAQMQAGRQVTVELVSLSSRDRSAPIVARINREVHAYIAAIGAERMILRGIAPTLARPITVADRDLATPEQRGARVLQLMSFYALFAGLMGAIAAALDVTAGERERQTLEPLLTSSVTVPELVLGKWLAVSGVNLLAVTASMTGFMIALQWVPLGRLGLPFSFGLREFGGFMAVLVPFAFMVPAILLMFGAAGKTAKEAQSALSVGVSMVGLLPLMSVFRQDKAPWWDVWVPVNGQYAVLSKVLRAEPVSALNWAAMWLVPALLCAVALCFFARRLGNEQMLAGR